MSYSAKDMATGRIIRLADGVESLEPLMAGGRYRCRSCGSALTLRGLKEDSQVAPHFSHTSGGPCPNPGREAELDAELEVVIKFRDRLRKANPGITCTLAAPGDDDPTDPIGLPPALIVCTAPDSTVVVERPGIELPGSGKIRRRITAVRDGHGGAEHVWFLRRDRFQFGKLGTLQVRIDGKDEEHETVAPTEQQEAIAEAGGSVYWLDGQLVQVPYGVHWFLHPVRAKQDWDFPRWRRGEDPRKDWRISHPRPRVGADAWGLVPLPLSALTRTEARFRPAQAHHMMESLARAESARYNWRRNRAFALYKERHQQPASAPAPMPEILPDPEPTQAEPAQPVEPQPLADASPALPPAETEPWWEDVARQIGVDVPPMPSTPPALRPAGEDDSGRDTGACG
ncbi:hypothetical protein [Streptacidiphilus neutrinimicus]|uniref:hypothetical protein n=1 Tax=Streptacidiphilus neutrinimicus TaxID=105420 RepID=UPI0005AAD3C4|nr:hypothetical protein [Streptacidiphilus neutrinimicus]